MHYGQEIPLWSHLDQRESICHALSREKRLSPGNPSKQAILALSFSICTATNLTCHLRSVESEMQLLGFLQFLCNVQFDFERNLVGYDVHF